MAAINNFRQLDVWQAAHENAVAIYRITDAFPAREQYGLSSQMQRAAVSVSANIAEGFGRITPKDKEHFYVMAGASLRELQSHLSIAIDLAYITKEVFIERDEAAEKIHRLLNGLLRAHRNNFGR